MKKYIWGRDQTRVCFPFLFLKMLTVNKTQKTLRYEKSEPFISIAKYIRRLWDEIIMSLDQKNIAELFFYLYIKVQGKCAMTSLLLACRI